ncbi:MAG TPA: hypothetical protein VHX39_31630 [Acetobacteraceae bacterium]|nr:hypothetical protein [Acetobacteraceae bacterium]
MVTAIDLRLIEDVAAIHLVMIVRRLACRRYSAKFVASFSDAKLVTHVADLQLVSRRCQAENKIPFDRWVAWQRDGMPRKYPRNQ